jgi:RNA polymerase sigma factor CnrH
MDDHWLEAWAERVWVLGVSDPNSESLAQQFLRELKNREAALGEVLPDFAEETLAVAAQAGFLYEAVFSELFYGRYHRWLRGFFSRGLQQERRPLGEAEDLTQELYLAQFPKRLRSYDRDRPFRPYVRQIATNAFTDFIRRRTNRSPAMSLDAIPEPASSPEHHSESSDFQERLEAAVARLPERQRRALALSLEGYKPGDIAKSLPGATLPAVHQLLHKARRSVCHWLRSPQVPGRETSGDKAIRAS